MTGQERTMDERAAETRELLDELRKHVQPDELATVGIIFDLDGFAETFSAVAAAIAEHEAEVARLRSDLDAAQRNQDMLAAVVDYGGQLDQLTDENDRLRAALNRIATLEEEANGG